MFSCAWERSDKSSGRAFGPGTGTGTTTVQEGFPVERVRDRTSLFPSRIDVATFVARAPEVLTHPFVGCSINVVIFLLFVWNQVSF